MHIGLRRHTEDRNKQDRAPTNQIIARQSTWQVRVNQDGKGSRGLWMMRETARPKADEHRDVKSFRIIRVLYLATPALRLDAAG